MKRLFLTICLCVLFASVFVAQVSAAPAWWITKPPVQPVPSNTGPAQDPDAILGQWFKDLGTGYEHAKPLEFYDNKYGKGGGYMSTFAIEGYATNIVYAAGPNSNILSFDIDAFITNDTGTEGGPSAPGTNSHGETLSDPVQYICDMWQTKLTAEFAIDQAAFSAWYSGTLSPPYRDTTPHIQAVNHDQLAWYCWAPGTANAGDYLVPTWDFGDILHDQTHSRKMQFMVSGTGLPSTDPRYKVIVDSNSNGWDLLSNRTTSLKISTWIDDLAIDPGTDYPAPPLRSSDVSVFFIPEPATVCLLGLGALSLIRKRRV